MMGIGYRWEQKPYYILCVFLRLDMGNDHKPGAIVMAMTDREGTGLTSQKDTLVD